MLAAAVVLAGSLLLVATALPAWLARVDWPQRSPALGLVLWQALGLAGGQAAMKPAMCVSSFASAAASG